MKQLGVLILVAVLLGCFHVAWAACVGDGPYCWLRVTWDDEGDGFGDEIRYDVYVDNGDYEVAVEIVSDWWGDRISSLYTWDNYPAHWLIYNDLDCNTNLGVGDGKKASLGANSDIVSSLKFSCPADEERTYFGFCEDTNYEGEVHAMHLYKHGNSNEVVMELRELDGHWNDEISAIQVGVEGTMPKAHCYWYFYIDEAWNSGGIPDTVLTDNDEILSLGDLNDEITSYRLVISDSETPPTISTSTGIYDDTTPGHDASYHLGQNVPNPFNPTTVIEYRLPQDEAVFLAVYDATGRLVRTLEDIDKPSGIHHVTWDGMDSSGNLVASGVYFYRIQAGSFTEVKKLVFLK